MHAPVKRIATGIDIGTHATRVIIMEHVRGETPRIIGTGVTESRGIRRGYIANKNDALRSISTAIAQAEKMAGFKIRNTILSVGGVSLESLISHGTATISRASGEIGDQDLKKAEEVAEEALPVLANKRIIYRVPISYRLDGKEVLGDPHNLTGTTIEVKMLFVTCLDHHLSDIIRAVEELGVEVDEVVPSPIAAGFIALTKKQRSVGCALVNIGAETVSIVVFENDLPISIQIFPIGSTDITNDIALGLKIPLEEAERIKVRGLVDKTFSKKKLGDIIEARLYDIFELIEAHLKKIKRNGLLPAGIILTGGGAGIATIEDLAKAVLKLPSAIADPALSSGGTKHPVKDSSWLVAYGLCVYALNKPEEDRPGSFSGLLETLKNWIKPFLP